MEPNLSVPGFLGSEMNDEENQVSYTMDNKMEEG